MHQDLHQEGSEAGSAGAIVGWMREGGAVIVAAPGRGDSEAHHA